MKFSSKFKHFYFRKCIWKCCLPKWRPSCLHLNVLSRSNVYRQMTCPIVSGWGKVTAGVRHTRVFLEKCPVPGHQVLYKNICLETFIMALINSNLYQCWSDWLIDRLIDWLIDWLGLALFLTLKGKIQLPPRWLHSLYGLYGPRLLSEKGH